MKVMRKLVSIDPNEENHKDEEAFSTFFRFSLP